MCHECNSSYKLKLDPVRHIDPISRKNTGNRRKAFYSYSPNNPAITLNVAIRTNDVTKLTPENIDLQLNSPGCNQEVESWCDVFGIAERYKAKCCAENDGKAWLNQIIGECVNHGQSMDMLLKLIFRAADRSPYDSANFLKKPFLVACQNAGLFYSALSPTAKAANQAVPAARRRRCHRTISLTTRGTTARQWNHASHEHRSSNPNCLRVLFPSL